MSVGKSKSKSKQTSRPLTADELSGYFNRLNEHSGGRVDDFARNGAGSAQYEALTPEQLRSLGGAGASREAALTDARANAISEINADPSLTTFQRQRARQLTDNDFSSRLDAIKAESEAALAGLASEEQARKYAADKDNRDRLQEELALLAQLFYGGKGSISEGSSGSRGFNIGFAAPK